jgi:hypothetical protein
MRVEADPASIKFFERGLGRVWVHPASVCFKAGSYPSGAWPKLKQQIADEQQARLPCCLPGGGGSQPACTTVVSPDMYITNPSSSSRIIAADAPLKHAQSCSLAQQKLETLLGCDPAAAADAYCTGVKAWTFQTPLRHAKPLQPICVAA